MYNFLPHDTVRAVASGYGYHRNPVVFWGEKCRMIVDGFIQKGLLRNFLWIRRGHGLSGCFTSTNHVNLCTENDPLSTEYVKEFERELISTVRVHLKRNVFTQIVFYSFSWYLANLYAWWKNNTFVWFYAATCFLFLFDISPEFSWNVAGWPCNPAERIYLWWDLDRLVSNMT